MIANESISAAFNSPVRSIEAKVELYNGSTLVDTYTESDRIVEVTIERVGEDSKFFGFGVTQKANVKLIDKDRNLEITTANSMKVYFDGLDAFPFFYVTEVNRDENTNQLSITAYDKLECAVIHTVSQLPYYADNDAVNVCSGAQKPPEEEVPEEDEDDFEIISYTILQFVSECAYLLCLDGFEIIGVDDMSCFNTFYESGANMDGTETIRDSLTWIAEVTQTVYYIDKDNNLVFKRPDKDGAAVFTIDKSMYFTMESGANKRLGTIYHVTELGDDVYASLDQTGTTQYVRDNPFWDLREDIATLVDNAFYAIAGMTINQFNCEWRGNPCLEVCDKIALATKDDELVHSYVFDDVITYNGTYKHETQWVFNDNDQETSDNPTSLGDVIKQTYAKVDKANKEITLLASEVDGTSKQVASILINTDSINQSVTDIQKQFEESMEGFMEEVGTLTNKVESIMTPEDVTFLIKEELQQTGIDAITTETGYTFNSEGLNVSKSDSEMSTLITEDGMTVSKGDEVMLKADNQGVTAKNLHAETYLWIGLNSRFEDFTQQEKNRTGCFWVGR